MKNVLASVKNGKLTLTIDLKQEGKASSSGKSLIIGSSEGFEKLKAEGFEKFFFTLTVGKSLEKEERAAKTEAKPSKTASKPSTEAKATPDMEAIIKAVLQAMNAQ